MFLGLLSLLILQSMTSKKKTVRSIYLLLYLLRMYTIYFFHLFFFISCDLSEVFFIGFARYVRLCVVCHILKNALNSYHRDTYRQRSELVLPKLVDDRLLRVIRFVVCYLFRTKWHPAHCYDNVRI